MILTEGPIGIPNSVKSSHPDYDLAVLHLLIEPRALWMRDKHSTMEVHPRPWFFEMGSHYIARIDLTLDILMPLPPEWPHLDILMPLPTEWPDLDTLTPLPTEWWAYMCAALGPTSVLNVLFVCLID